jgi:hypothetical protein
MTQQIRQSIIVDGMRMSMDNEPLGQYFRLTGNRPDFGSVMTANWKGYSTSWEIINSRLYLMSLYGQLKNGTEVSITSLFPDYPDKVFANWYCGCLEIPLGDIIRTGQKKNGRTEHEKLWHLNVERGVVTSRTMHHNKVDLFHPA